MLYFIARAPYDGDGGGGRVARVYWKTGFEKHIAHKIEQDLSRHTKQQQQAESRETRWGVFCVRFMRDVTREISRQRFDVSKNPDHP